MRIEQIYVTGADIESCRINLKYSGTDVLHPKERVMITSIDGFKGYLRKELSGITCPLPPIRIDERIAKRELLQQYTDEVLAEITGS
jgi:hypothetical protein